MTTIELKSAVGIAGMVAGLAFLLLGGAANLAVAQQPEVHYLHQGMMPPGAIGGRQLLRGGPLPGYFQPVEIKAPPGVLVSLAVGGQFDEPRPAPTRVGMLIGQVYRLRITNIPQHPGLEVFPTIEVIDRLYPPRGQEQRFAIPVELTQIDLQLGLQGKFVTRVIYLEDPRQALPVGDNPRAQEWYDVGPGGDPLAAADALGRPVAILRMGARLPDTQGPDMQFLFGCPPVVQYPPRRAMPVPAAAPPAGEDAAPAPATAPAAEPAPANVPPALPESGQP